MSIVITQSVGIEGVSNTMMEDLVSAAALAQLVSKTLQLLLLAYFFVVKP